MKLIFCTALAIFIISSPAHAEEKKEKGAHQDSYVSQKLVNIRNELKSYINSGVRVSKYKLEFIRAQLDAIDVFVESNKIQVDENTKMIANEIKAMFRVLSEKK